jgi:protein-L-isoaspartate(D-aspartate) O-methyltransferase
MTQPFVAALMTELLDIQPSDRILEIGTGSGYESAVLSRLCRHVYSIEILPGMARRAEERLRALGCTNVSVRIGDGYGGWPDEAPFDGIVVSAAPRTIPPALLDQLAPNGRMVIPVGDFFQELKVFARDARGEVTERSVLPVRFVPMSGEAATR